MLARLSARGFKSLAAVTVDLPRLAVFYGPNAAGKSNLLEAIQALGRLGTARSLTDALGDSAPMRGRSFEAFAFPAGGLPELLRQASASFVLEADLAAASGKFRYKIELAMDFASGRLSVADEFLAKLTAAGEPARSPRPAIARANGKFMVRGQARGDRPREVRAGLDHSILSDRSLGGGPHPRLEQVREELRGWRMYSLDPRRAMRAERPPADVADIEPRGEALAPFLHKLKTTDFKRFEHVRRTLRAIVPAVESLDVNLDGRRGTLDLEVRQDGVNYSSRLVSEGTLRALALCAIALNPWQEKGSLLTFEEPENGVDPAQLDLIAKLLLGMTGDEGRQAVVVTYSPLLCDAILKEIEEAPDGAADVGLFSVRRERQGTAAERLALDGPLFADRELTEALTGAPGMGLFQNLLLRGYA